VKVIAESVVITKLDIYVYTIVILNFHYMYIDYKHYIKIQSSELTFFLTCYCIDMAGKIPT
jgi:hypothetical protein